MIVATDERLAKKPGFLARLSTGNDPVSLSSHAPAAGIRRHTKLRASATAFHTLDTTPFRKAEIGLPACAMPSKNSGFSTSEMPSTTRLSAPGRPLL